MDRKHYDLSVSWSVLALVGAWFGSLRIELWGSVVLSHSHIGWHANLLFEKQKNETHVGSWKGTRRSSISDLQGAVLVKAARLENIRHWQTRRSSAGSGDEASVVWRWRGIPGTSRNQLLFSLTSHGKISQVPDRDWLNYHKGCSSFYPPIDTLNLDIIWYRYLIGRFKHCLCSIIYAIILAID